MGDIIQFQKNELNRFFRLEKNGLVVSGTPSLELWSELGEGLKRIEGATQWWRGDWYTYGNTTYGAMAKDSVDDGEHGYIRNLKYVSSHVQLSRRRDNLLWAHHQEVAPLPEKEQDYWLDEAEENEWKVKELRNAIRDSKPSEYPAWLQYTDTWNIPYCDERFGDDYPGRIPGQVVQNLLYYYTNRGGMVVDPMAGGGVTEDVCASLDRGCISFDVAPSRETIDEHDATKTWSVSNADLVFIDPPYWSQMEDDYAGMAAIPLDEFMKQMTDVFRNAYQALKDGGILAVLIAPMAIKVDYADLPFEFARICLDSGFSLERRISVPVSSQQVGPRVMATCKKNKIMVALIRDLLIFKK